MRLEGLKLRGFGPFRETVEVDFGKLGDALLVAICGENGAGKSTLLELAFGGSMYRQTPTRGSLGALATSRDAFLEARLVNGRAYTLRHLVDAVNGKGESVALGPEGPLFESSKMRDFDRWASKALPAPEVLYSTVFSPQGAGGFLAAKPAERKGILLRALGVERIEAMAEHAREHRREAKAAVDLATARLADERARGGDVAALEVALRDAQSAATAAEADVARCRADLEKAREEARQAEQARKDAEAIEQQRRELYSSATEAQQKVTDLKRRLINNRAVLAQRSEIREACEAQEALRERLTELRARVAELEAEALQAQAESDGYARQELDHADRMQSEQTRIERLRLSLEREPEVQRAVQELPELRSSVELCRSHLASAERELERLRDQRIAGADKRIGSLRGSLDLIRRDAKHGLSGEDAGRIAEEALSEDQIAVDLKEELPRKIEAAQGEVAMYRASLRRAESVLQHSEQLASKLDGLAADREAILAAEAAQRAAYEAAGEAQSKREESAAKVSRARRAAGADVREIQSTEKTLQRVASIAAKAAPLAQAEARISELEPQINQLEATVARLETELADTPVPASPPRGPEVSLYEQALAGAEDAARLANSAVAVAEQRLTAARESAARVAELEAEQRTAEAELADWSRLAEDLGRNGLQAAEIDAAGPELTELTNDLLHICHGPRFTVRVDTQRASADGKRLLEGCEVVVIDTERGREAAGETFSGGERVIIGEALSLALSMLACRRAGVEGPTLVRDESGAALDPANARVYVSMLRRAAQQIGASRVLFVAHNPEIQEMADARIVVADGRVQVAT